MLKIMFDKLEKIPVVNGIKLYIQLESHAEVGIEEIQQTITSLQVTVPDAQYEYSTHVDDDDVHADDDDESDDDDYVYETTVINDEDFVDRNEVEDRIEQGDFERDIDGDETLDGGESNGDNVINVQNITDTIPPYASPALSFSANTRKNMVDPSHIEIPFVSTWWEGINLCKGLTFANKVEV